MRPPLLDRLLRQGLIVTPDTLQGVPVLLLALVAGQGVPLSAAVKALAPIQDQALRPRQPGR